MGHPSSNTHKVVFAQERVRRVRLKGRSSVRYPNETLRGVHAHRSRVIEDLTHAETSTLCDVRGRQDPHLVLIVRVDDLSGRRHELAARSLQQRLEERLFVVVEIPLVSIRQSKRERPRASTSRVVNTKTARTQNRSDTEQKGGQERDDRPPEMESISFSMRGPSPGIFSARGAQKRSVREAPRQTPNTILTDRLFDLLHN